MANSNWVDLGGQLFYGSAFDADPATFPTKLASSVLPQTGDTVYDRLAFASGAPSAILRNVGKVIRAVQATVEVITTFEPTKQEGVLVNNTARLVDGWARVGTVRIKLPCVMAGLADRFAEPPDMANGQFQASAWSWSTPSARLWSGEWTSKAIVPIDVPDTSLPIGFLANGADARESEGWGGGIALLSFHRRSGALAQFTKLRLLLSTPPVWSYVAPTASILQAGKTYTFQIKAWWDVADPVMGLALRVSTATGNFGLRAAGSSGTFSREIAVQTDASGVATVEVQGVAAGVGEVRIAAQDQEVGRLFSPSLLGVYQLTVEGSVAPPTDPSCVSYPAQPAVPAVPARIDVTDVYEWDAGANSIDTVEGDAFVRFEMGAVVGVVVGFTTNREEVPALSRLEHALYFCREGNQCRAQVMESGTLKGAAWDYIAGDQFELRRVGESVTYWHNAQKAFASRAPSIGTLTVGSALYASGDLIA